MIKNYFKEIWRDRFILWSLVNRDLQMKYKKSVLGVAWSILTPLGLVVIIGSVYAIIFSADPKMFIPLLFAGLNPWIFINSSADGGTSAFISAEGYLKQTTVSAQIFPLRTVMVGFVNLLYSVVTFFSIYLFLQPQLFGAIMLLVVPGLFILFVFTLSLANIAAVLNLNIRDYQPFQSLALQGMFYITPIIFQADMLKEKGFEKIYECNPVYYMLEVVRTPMLGESIPSANIYLTASSIALVSFLVSVVIVMKAKKEIAFKL